ERVHSARTALNDTVRAATRAMRDRQTVVLSLPIDTQDEVLPDGVAAPTMPAAIPPVIPSSGAIERLVDAILQAKRPVILAGRGSVIADAEDDLVALGDRIGAVLTTTVCGH